jgi:hypothetical protein
MASALIIRGVEFIVLSKIQEAKSTRVESTEEFPVRQHKANNVIIV